MSEIEYTRQNLCQVKINKQWFPLGLNIKSDINIELGDKIEKEAYSNELYLFRKDSAIDITSERKYKLVKKFCKP